MIHLTYLITSIGEILHTVIMTKIFHLTHQNHWENESLYHIITMHLSCMTSSQGRQSLEYCIFTTRHRSISSVKSSQYQRRQPMELNSSLQDPVSNKSLIITTTYNILASKSTKLATCGETMNLKY